MSSELEELIESSQVKEDDSGVLRYTAESDKQPGSIVAGGIGTPFTPDTGRAAALARWERSRTRAEIALLEWAREDSGNRDMDYDEAFNYVISNPLFDESKQGKTPAAKLILQMLDNLPRPLSDSPKVDKRRVNFTVVNVRGYQGLVDYINRLEQKGLIRMAEFARLQLDEIDSGFQDVIQVTVPVGKDVNIEKTA